jgi:carbamoyl-phosphate synthase/aspartate carbamoyltransferase/dihydroorotase
MTIWQSILFNLAKTTPLTSPMPKGVPWRLLYDGSPARTAQFYAHFQPEKKFYLLRKAKEKGIQVTCEVLPPHLNLQRKRNPKIGAGRSEVRPTIKSEYRLPYFTGKMDVIDCFATDHAPHTLSEKDSPNPPPGFPGLETPLPLLLTAVHEGRLSMQDIITRLYTNPKRIFNLPDQPDTWVEIDPQLPWQIRAAETFTRCGWTPFEGKSVFGKVKQVVLRGNIVFKDGKVLAQPGTDMKIRKWLKKSSCIHRILEMVNSIKTKEIICSAQIRIFYNRK